MHRCCQIYDLPSDEHISDRWRSNYKVNCLLNISKVSQLQIPSKFTSKQRISAAVMTVVNVSEDACWKLLYPTQISKYFLNYGRQGTLQSLAAIISN